MVLSRRRTESVARSDYSFVDNMASLGLFSRSLRDMVRGIRGAGGDEPAFVQKCLAEIKDELRGRDIQTKGVALQKLAYLHMLGEDVSWAAFHVTEVMPQVSAVENCNKAQRRVNQANPSFRICRDRSVF